MKRVRIEVPASSANLGPGFDCLGLALSLADVVCAEFDPESREVVLAEVTGTSHRIDPHDNLLCQAYRAWAEETGTELPGARFTLESHIPIAKGFGSSAACIVAGLGAAAAAVDEKNAEERILRLATRMEGHPDNVSAALMGGMTVAFCTGEQVHAINVANHLYLGVSLFVPEQPLNTAEARRALPAKVPLADAVFDLGRLAYLTTALIWGRWDSIGPAMQDRLHQPYRLHLIPALDDVIAAALEAGAYGAALSGGGPSVIALGPPEMAEDVAAAMTESARSRGWEGEGLVTQVREAGVQVKEVKEGEEQEPS